MTRKTKSRTTKRATKASPQDQKIGNWLENWDLFSMMNPPSEEPLSPGEYAVTGRCGICFHHIEAIQPGGLQPRHCADQTPLCSTKRKG